MPLICSDWPEEGGLRPALTPPEGIAPPLLRLTSRPTSLDVVVVVVDFGRVVVVLLVADVDLGRVVVVVLLAAADLGRVVVVVDGLGCRPRAVVVVVDDLVVDLRASSWSSSMTWRRARAVVVVVGSWST